LDSDRIHQIVLEELQKVLGSQRGASSAPPSRSAGKLLVLCTGCEGCGPQSLEPLELLRAEGYQLVFALSHSFQLTTPSEHVLARFPGAEIHLQFPSPEKLRGLVSESKALIAPYLSRTTATKTSLGITDSLPTKLLLEALTQKKPTLAARNCLDPDAAPGEKSCPGLAALPEPLRRSARDVIHRLELLGVTFAARSDFFVALVTMLRPPAADELPPIKPLPLAKPRVFVTREDLQEAKIRGEKSYPVPAGAIVTDLAREFAQYWAIALMPKDEGK